MATTKEEFNRKIEEQRKRDNEMFVKAFEESCQRTVDRRKQQDEYNKKIRENR